VVSGLSRASKLELTKSEACEDTKTSVAALKAGNCAPAYPAHCVVTGQIDARQGVDGRPYAIGFEFTPLAKRIIRAFYGRARPTCGPRLSS